MMGLLLSRRQATKEADSKPGTLPSEDVAWLKREVFLEAGAGRLPVMSKLVELSQDVSRDVLESHHSTQDGCRHTPLTMAVALKRVPVLRLLLGKFHTDFEKNVVLDSLGRNVMTALQVAVAHNAVFVVRALVVHGADVNQTNYKNETPLHIACLQGHLDVVKYLVENGARTDALDDEGYTCLMRACQGDHTQVVCYLLRKGVNPNQASPVSGMTALHVVAEIQESARTALVLVEFGAKLTEDATGRTPLVKGILLRSREFVEFILALAPITQQERVDGHELWAAVLATRNIEEAYCHLRTSMTYRLVSRGRVLPKPHLPPVPALGNITESQTLKQLLERRCDPVSLTTECLLIVKRHLGAEEPFLGCMYTCLCNLLLLQKSFLQAAVVWLHGWKTTTNKSGQFGIYEIFQHIALSMVSKIETSKNLPSQDVREVLEFLLTEMGEQALSGNILARNRTEALEYVSSCFLLIATAVLADPASNDKEGLRTSVRRLVQIHAPFCVQRPIIHHAIEWEADSDRMVGDTFRQHRWLRGRVLELLLTCGKYLDVNGVDAWGITALKDVARRTGELGTDLAIRMTVDLLGAGARKDSASEERLSPPYVVTLL